LGLVIGCKLDNKFLDVTGWAEYGYKENQTTEVEMPCYWVAGRHALDFRSPEELNKGHFVNSMRFEGFVPTSGINKGEELKEAVFFARVLGRITKQGYLVTKFGSGVYYEALGINGWARDTTVEDVFPLIKWRLENEANNN
jgi:hypothetical protein